MPPALQDWVRKCAGRLRVLIPGAGTGYEVRLFAERGHDVLAIDFSDAALEAAKRELRVWSGCLLKADFFTFKTDPFDLIYERAFLCALPRRLWPAWARRIAELVRPGGALAGFFYFDDNERGPPFGIAAQAPSELMQKFELIEDREIPAAQSLPVFKGKERWQVWRRRL